MTRRKMLKQASLGFGSIALTAMLQEHGWVKEPLYFCIKKKTLPGESPNRQGLKREENESALAS